MTIIPLILLVVIMYFLMIRPQRKREKETTAMRNSLQVGDEIVTIGGLCGKIVRTKDESIVIQTTPDKVKMEMMRWSVSKVTKEGSGHNKATDEYEEMEAAEEKEVQKSQRKRLKKKAPVVEEEAAEEAKDAAEEVSEEVKDTADEAAEDVKEAAEDAKA